MPAVDAVLDVLAASPLLTIFLVVALGTALGAVPFGPVRFGAAGALFVGLAVGALDPRLGEGLALVQTLGLALFVYTVGLAAVSGRRWPSRRDPEPAAGLGLDAVTARVDRPTLLADVPGFADGQVRMSYLSREGRTRVVAPDEQLQPGDRVVVVGPSVAAA